MVLVGEIVSSPTRSKKDSADVSSEAKQGDSRYVRRTTRSTHNPSSPKARLSGRRHPERNSSSISSASDSSRDGATRAMFIPGITGRPRCLEHSVLESRDEISHTRTRARNNGEQDGETPKADPSSGSPRQGRTSKSSSVRGRHEGTPISRLIHDIRSDRMELLRNQTSQSRRNGIELAQTSSIDDIQGVLASYASKKKDRSQYDVQRRLSANTA